MYWFSRRHKNETFFIIQCSLHYFNKNNKHCPVYHFSRSNLYRNAILALKSLTDHEGEEGAHATDFNRHLYLSVIFYFPYHARCRGVVMLHKKK